MIENRATQTNVLINISTKDLSAHRQAAADAVSQAGMLPLGITAQETTRNTFDEALELVDRADIYVGIWGARYGYVPRSDNPEELSLSELQYRRALKREIPVIICIISDTHPLLGQVGALDSTGVTLRFKKKLDDLKKEMRANHSVIEFASPEELGAQLLKVLNALKAPSQPDLESPVLEVIISAPSPAEPLPLFVVHPCMVSGTFCGRHNELTLLNDWASSAPTMLMVEGIGGIGKSALAWHWFNESAPQVIPNLAGMIWWSFNESDALLSNFVQHTLAFVTGKSVDLIGKMAPAARERALLTMLREKPYLLVLDDVERLLNAYHRMDAPYLTEIKIEQDAKHGDPSLRQCADPAHGAFLQKLLECKASKILIISRLMPHQLQDQDGMALPGVYCLHLDGLMVQDALTLVKSFGVSSSDDRALINFMAQFENHSLVLQLAARQIKNRAEGDFDQWNTGEGKNFSLPDLDPLHQRANLVNEVLATLSPDLRTLMDYLAAFRFPVPFEALAAVNPYGPPPPPRMAEPRRWQPNYAEAKAAWEVYQRARRNYEAELGRVLAPLREGLAILEARGLLLWDHGADRFDLHPLIRGCVCAQLEGENLIKIFARIRDYFESLPSQAEVHDFSDLRRPVEIYHTLISAGMLDAAAALYRAQFSKLLSTQVATPYQMIELLRPLFPGGPGTLPALSTAKDRGYFANELAVALGQAGQITEALALMGLTLGAFAQERNSASLCAALIHYAGLLRDDRQMAAKLHVFELARDLAAAAKDTENLAVANLFSLKSYADNGQWAAAEASHQAFGASPLSHRTVYRQAMAERIYAKILLYQGKNPSAALDLAMKLAMESGSKHEQRAIYALWGEAALQRGHPDSAQRYFEEALRLAEQLGVSTNSYAGGLARALAAQGQLTEARALVERGVSSAAAAEVYLALDEKKQAAQAALEAYRIAWAEGPPFSFWWELEQARKLLTALGLAEPVLPPSASVRPIPYDAEIRQFIAHLKSKRPGEPVG